MRATLDCIDASEVKQVERAVEPPRVARAPEQPRVCDRCGALFFRRRRPSAHLPAPGDAGAPDAPGDLLCPACRMAVALAYRGEVRIVGCRALAHRASIERLLRDEAERAADNNPTARIFRIDRTQPDRWVVFTTTARLARRIGRALERSIRGHVTCRVSHEEACATVIWTREP